MDNGKRAYKYTMINEHIGIWYTFIHEREESVRRGIW
jgi:hypothetical protein